MAEALESAKADVLIDYTSAAAVKANVWTAVGAGVHAVIGSSGLTAKDYAELDRLARDRGVGVIAAGNFSVMAAVLRRAASMAARHLDRWEIIDYASDDKPDLPSGTSRELAETLAQVREPAITVALSDLHGPVEARGVEVAGTRVHSVRLPSFVVTTEVVFGGPGERLVIRHDPGLTPAPYVAGTLLAVRNVADVAGVCRGLDSVLFGNTPQTSVLSRRGTTPPRPHISHDRAQGGPHSGRAERPVMRGDAPADRTVTNRPDRRVLALRTRPASVTGRDRLRARRTTGSPIRNACKSRRHT